MREDVLFRGTRNGVLMVLNDQTDYQVLKERLAERLAAAENFFYPGAGVTLDVGSRILTTSQLLDLEELLQHPHGLRLINVIHSSPASTATAVDQGPAATTAPATATTPTAATTHAGAPAATMPAAAMPATAASAAAMPATAASAAAMPATAASARPPAFTPAAAHAPTANAAASTAAGASGGVPGADDLDTVLIKRTLRSGQRVRYNGNVVILGEVNPGAEVVAAGDIVVMGALRGVAHAGAGGREDAIVVAFRLQPTQLRIAGYIARAPEGAVAPDGPELARVQDGTITIEADPHRFF